MRFVLNKNGFNRAVEYLDRLSLHEKTVSIEVENNTRTNRQNAALYLFFQQVSDTLNDAGIYFKYKGLTGKDLEMQWDKDLFKRQIWLPLQKYKFDTDSTTKLKTNQIDEIFDIICNHLAQMGIEIVFPNQFDFYLKMQE